MNKFDKDNFLKSSSKAVEDILDILLKLPKVSYKEFKGSQTALVIVDLINGFVREGALKSPRVEEIIEEISGLSRMCDKIGAQKIAFADSHTEASPEFDSYPVHCLCDTSEAEVVDEVKEIGGYKLIPKNSTNGFHEAKFKEWLNENKEIDTFIITGDCTDICVQQFSITLKTWFNMNNKKVRIIVPINAVETYDLNTHNADLVNVMALYNMMINGIEIVEMINYKG